jgi:hypothetical protein
MHMGYMMAALRQWVCTCMPAGGTGCVSCVVWLPLQLS